MTEIRVYMHITSGHVKIMIDNKAYSVYSSKNTHIVGESLFKIKELEDTNFFHRLHLYSTPVGRELLLMKYPKLKEYL